MPPQAALSPPKPTLAIYNLPEEQEKKRKQKHEENKMPTLAHYIYILHLYRAKSANSNLYTHYTLNTVGAVVVAFIVVDATVADVVSNTHPHYAAIQSEMHIK